jgi:hypothetical protein
MGEQMSPRRIAMLVIVGLAALMIFLTARATPPSQTMNSRVSDSAPTGATPLCPKLCDLPWRQPPRSTQLATSQRRWQLPAPPHDASGHTWHHSDAYLIAVTTYGGAAVTGVKTNAMPAFQESIE